MNPLELLAQGKEDYLVSIALIEKALEISQERKMKEIEILAKLTGHEVAQVIAKIF